MSEVKKSKLATTLGTIGAVMSIFIMTLTLIDRFKAKKDEKDKTSDT